MLLTSHMICWERMIGIRYLSSSQNSGFRHPYTWRNQMYEPKLHRIQVPSNQISSLAKSKSSPSLFIFFPSLHFNVFLCNKMHYNFFVIEIERELLPSIYTPHFFIRSSSSSFLCQLHDIFSTCGFFRYSINVCHQKQLTWFHSSFNTHQIYAAQLYVIEP